MEFLLPDQKQELKQIFDMFAKVRASDVTGKPTVGPKEVHTVLTACGVVMTEGEVADLLTIADTTGRGILGFEDFAHLMTLSMNDSTAEADHLEVFARIDADRDGFLNAEDIDQFAHSMTSDGAGDEALNAALRASLSAPDIEALVKELAEKRERGVSKSDFFNMLKAQVSMSTTMQLEMAKAAEQARALELAAQAEAVAKAEKAAEKPTDKDKRVPSAKSTKK